MIAPYWSDVDTRCGGDIYYRQLKILPGSDISYEIQQEVALTGLGADFKPSALFIATWEGVMSTNDVPCTDQRVSPHNLSLIVIAAKEEFLATCKYTIL